jgi:hypothetical protein
VAEGTPQPASGRVFGALDERERQIDDDYEWCLHSEEVQKAYAGKVVATYKRRIWGAGKNHGAAIRAGQRKAGCPPKENMAYVYIEGYTLPTRS